MWPLGHAAVAYLCYALSTRTRAVGPPGGASVLFVLVGSQLPDLVDKPLAWYLGALPTGRTFAHSLVVLVPFALAAYALARRSGRGEYGVAVAVGALSHTLVDALPALWGSADPAHLLWPVVAVEPYESGPPSVLALFRNALGEPYFLAEFVLAAVALAAWRAHGCPGLEPCRSLLARARPAADAPER